MEVTEEPVAESDNVLVQLVNKMIMDAYHGGISDIHVETYPGKQNTRVRFRKDGTLVDYLQIPSNFRNSVISRIEDHGATGYLRAAQTPGRQARLPAVRPGKDRTAHRDHSHRQSASRSVLRCPAAPGTP